MDVKKKIIIIGGGISGLSAGIYGLDNDFDVTIYEKHSIAGGQCTGWVRDNSFIDGCAHWIVGTSPKSKFYPLWRYVGAFDNNSIVYETEYFSKFDIDGEVVTFYSNLDKLEAELLRVGPDDKKQIKRFIRGIKAYMHVDVPMNKPLDHYNIFEYLVSGLKMLPMAFHYAYYRKLSIEEYALKFKSVIIRKVLERIMSPKYNIHSLVYTMQTLAQKDSGVVEGGSLRFAHNIKNNFISKGGKIVVNNEIKKIVVENNKVVGVMLKDNNIVNADYVIATCDIHHTLYDLLDNKYTEKYYSSRFENNEDYPLNCGLHLAFKLTKDMDKLPKMMNFEIPETCFANNKYTDITIRNHYFNKTICKDSATLTLLFDADQSTYDYLAKLDIETYQKIKIDFANKIKQYIIDYFKLEKNSISFLDFATPLTYNRYTNSYKGSYMSFVTTKKAKGLMKPGIIKGLDNITLAGQWLMSPGGLPIALFTGKHAIYRICKMENKKFVSLDSAKHYVLGKANI